MARRRQTSAPDKRDKPSNAVSRPHFITIFFAVLAAFTAGGGLYLTRVGQRLSTELSQKTQRAFLEVRNGQYRFHGHTANENYLPHTYFKYGELTFDIFNRGNTPARAVRLNLELTQPPGWTIPYDIYRKQVPGRLTIEIGDIPPNTSHPGTYSFGANSTREDYDLEEKIERAIKEADKTNSEPFWPDMATWIGRVQRVYVTGRLTYIDIFERQHDDVSWCWGASSSETGPYYPGPCYKENP